VLALSISVISFPLMLDRDVGLVPAVVASVRLAREIPGAIALWGLIVAAALVIGSLPLFLGLAVVMPVLGHANWRPYRRAVQRDPAREVSIKGSGGAGLAGIPALQPLWVSLICLNSFGGKDKASLLRSGASLAATRKAGRGIAGVQKRESVGPPTATSAAVRGNCRNGRDQFRGTHPPRLRWLSGAILT
jgi:hypothetical protein